MKHGPLASVSSRSFVWILAPQEGLREKNIITIKELKSRGVNHVTLIKQKGQDFPVDCYNNFIDLPKAPEFLLPVLATIPIQLFALGMAEVRNLNVDKPRHLAKSVTVE